MRTHLMLMGACLAAALTAVLPANSSFAASPYGRPSGGSSSGSSSTSGQNSATYGARQQVTEAQKNVAKIRQDMNRLRSKVRVSLETKDDWAQAKANLKTA